MTDDDTLDAELRRLAHPSTRATPAFDAELASLTLATMNEVTPKRPRRAWRLGLAGGLSLAAVLCVGATAVAVGIWAPWAEMPDGRYTYTLPSGIECEERVGDLYADNPDIQRAVQDIFATTDVVADSPIDKYYREYLQAEESALEYAESRVEIDGGPGAATTDDVIYGMAVSRAVAETVEHELSERGFDLSDERNMISVRGQSLCGTEIP